MSDSPNNRLLNLRSIIGQYNENDKTYILNVLSNLVSTNFNKNNFQISYQNLIEDKTLSQYLNDIVYKNILKVISDFNDYKSLQRELQIYSPSFGYSGSDITNNRILDTQASTLLNPFQVDTTNKAFNVAFNNTFTDQLAKNKIERILSEQKKLQSLIQHEKPIEKTYKPFHELTIYEFSDNLANTITTLFHNIFTLNFSESGILSTNYYIYYGCILIFIYIILNILNQQTNKTGTSSAKFGIIYQP